MIGAGLFAFHGLNSYQGNLPLQVGYSVVGTLWRAKIQAFDEIPMNHGKWLKEGQKGLNAAQNLGRFVLFATKLLFPVEIRVKMRCRGTR
jgi:hypothetical protein